MREILSCTIIMLTVGCAGATSTVAEARPEPDGPVRILAASDVVWGHLNPARGDRSPGAADLWGDRKERGPSGFLARFADGFSSPPHIHNVTYRGVVIEGLVHNDDPAAESMWMPAGSFWTQPKGAAHITSARGSATIAYVEIDDGPYLVQPTDEATPSTEYPVNVHASNVVWHHPDDVLDGPKVAYLWGAPDDGPNGLFVAIPAGASATLRGLELRVVVIVGTAEHGGSEPVALTPGSHVGTSGALELGCSVERACVLYVRADDRVEVGGK